MSTVSTGQGTGRATNEEVTALAEQVENAVPQVRDLNLHLTAAGNVSLAMIRIHKSDRGRGHGARALRLITEWADQRGVTLTVTTYPAHLDGERRTGKKRLRRWYVRNRFRNNRGRHPQYSDSMVREPARPQA